MSCEIKISRANSGLRQAIPIQVETLLHEIIHAIDNVYCDRVFNEMTINRLSELWFQIIIDNNLTIK